ncbi:hypothetical protein S7711_00433 [Stachybotrys chartarum IBT 7711]|uniref:Uncharacterized protein n=1 Tax=Stachybotrys chartarum (strain CBS 109288 / IBT 7711) TaxID=1280523 RepID=A0A084B9P6_STACB|nr:hypothetical protein S7711_00433 [Stachybotrys chartarum IBT 7711]KFA77874.1 hypothetical protein S40288_02505 [Stachybotrys chartarum IBT 40288]
MTATRKPGAKRSLSESFLWQPSSGKHICVGGLRHIEWTRHHGITSTSPSRSFKTGERPAVFKNHANVGNVQPLCTQARSVPTTCRGSSDTSPAPAQLNNLGPPTPPPRDQPQDLSASEREEAQLNGHDDEETLPPPVRSKEPVAPTRKRLRALPPNAPRLMERKGPYIFRSGLRIADFKIPRRKLSQPSPASLPFQCRDGFDDEEIRSSSCGGRP